MGCEADDFFFSKVRPVPPLPMQVIVLNKHAVCIKTKIEHRKPHNERAMAGSQARRTRLYNFYV